MRFFVGYEHAADTFLSRTHVPVSNLMTVAVMSIFQYCGWQFICGSKMVSSISGLSKIEESDIVFVVELLKNVHFVAPVHDCDS